MTLSEKQRVFTSMVADLIIWAEEQGYGLTFGEVWRSDEQHVLNLKSGKSKAARSKHQDRLAVDFNLFIDDEYVTDSAKYRPLGEHWELIGGRWGGRFGVEPINWATKVGWDANHFEFKD
jgi:hypothetical protein